MIKTSYGWALSPAYDLLNVYLVNPEDMGELAFTISGKKKKIILQNFIDFGLSLELSEKQMTRVVNRFSELQNNALNLIESSFMSNDMLIAYKETFVSRFELINSDE